MLLRIKVPYNLLATKKKKKKGISTDANHARNFLPTLFEFLWLHSISHEQSAGFHMKWKKQPIKAVNLEVFRFVSFSLCITYIFVLFMSVLKLMTFETAWSNVTAKEKRKKKPETNCIVFLITFHCFLELFTEQSNCFHSQVLTQLSVFYARYVSWQLWLRDELR